MGTYLSPGADRFADIRRNNYVDKTSFLRFVNEQIESRWPDNLLCITRPQQFGKTFAAQMLTAYYDRSCNSEELFQSLQIAEDPSFRKHLNQYHVISFSCLDFIRDLPHMRVTDRVSGQLRKAETADLAWIIDVQIRQELLQVWPEAANTHRHSLAAAMYRVAEMTQTKFVVIIDDFDAISRTFPEHQELQEDWFHFLRRLFAAQDTANFISLGYLTGRLPVRCIGMYGALPDFLDCTMLLPQPTEPYFGFLEDEVKALAAGSALSFQELQSRFDGYLMGETCVYNPLSVMKSIEQGTICDAWTQMDTGRILLYYLEMDFDGLSEALVQLLSRESVPVNTSLLQKVAVPARDRNSVLTMLIHFGYLAYDNFTRMASIPNLELLILFRDVICRGTRTELAQMIRSSANVMDAIRREDPESVAQAVEQIQDRLAASLNYSSQDCLRSTLRAALFNYAECYSLPIELPSCRGCADLLCLPRSDSLEPAILLELKWNQADVGAVLQILHNNIPPDLRNYNCRLLLIQITYRSRSRDRTHTCTITPLTL